MKNGKAGADLRNELKRSGEHDDGGGGDVGGDGGITHGVSSNVPAADEFMPRKVVAAQRGKAVEGCHSKGENQLTDEGGHKPEARGSFQAGVSDRNKR